MCECVCLTGIYCRTSVTLSVMKKKRRGEIKRENVHKEEKKRRERRERERSDTDLYLHQFSLLVVYSTLHKRSPFLENLMSVITTIINFNMILNIINSSYSADAI